MKLGVCSLWGPSLEASRAQVRLASDLGAFIAVNAMAFRTPGTFATISAHFQAKVRGFQARYAPTEHVVVGGRNVGLMQEPGLTEFLSGFDTLAGWVENATAMLRALEEMGVSTFIAALPGHAAPLETIRGLADARNAM